MFATQNKEFIIGGIIWVFKLDPNATSLKELGHPKAYIYKGKYSKPSGEFLLLYDNDNNTEKKVQVDIDSSQVATGHYIISQTRRRIIERVNNVARRPAINESYGFVASKYLEYLKVEKPEWIIW